MDSAQSRSLDEEVEEEVVWTIVVAGGSGRRFGAMKQYEQLADGRRVIDWSVAVAKRASHGVVVVLPADDVYSASTGADVEVAGGTTRTESAAAGLAAVPASATVIAVHDAARPFASRGLYESCVAAVRAGADGAVPGVPVTDTIKVRTADGAVVATPDRATLVAVQTPQVFRAGALRAAFAAGLSGTDDASMVEANGGRVVVVDGEVDNRKITLPADLEWARAHSGVELTGAS